MPSEFLRIWRFHAHPARVAEFRTAYGPDGAWTAELDRACAELTEEEHEVGAFSAGS